MSYRPREQSIRSKDVVPYVLKHVKQAPDLCCQQARVVFRLTNALMAATSCFLEIDSQLWVKCVSDNLQKRLQRWLAIPFEDAILVVSNCWRYALKFDWTKA